MDHKHDEYRREVRGMLFKDGKPRYMNTWGVVVTYTSISRHGLMTHWYIVGMTDNAHPYFLRETKDGESAYARASDEDQRRVEDMLEDEDKLLEETELNPGIAHDEMVDYLKGLAKRELMDYGMVLTFSTFNEDATENHRHLVVYTDERGAALSLARKEDGGNEVVRGKWQLFEATKGFVNEYLEAGMLIRHPVE